MQREKLIKRIPNTVKKKEITTRIREVTKKEMKEETHLEF